MNIPNVITLCRIFLVPVIILLIVDRRMELAFWVTFAAAVSDAADGIIAKHFNMKTTLGAYLDPIADKALLVSLYIALGYEGFLPTWLIVLVVFRDTLIIGGALLFHTLTLSLEMNPLKISKFNTVTQLVLGIAVLATEAFALDTGFFIGPLIYVAGITTVVSGAIYVTAWTNKASDMESAK